MTTTYIPTSQIANDPAGILWLEKRGGQPGKTTLEDIKDALTEYQTNFTSGNVSKAEILTLHRAFPDSPTYKQAAVGIQKMDMVDPLVIGGPASVEMIDREGHLITTNALSKAFDKFMESQRTRNVMVLHSDVQVGWALPAYISKGGQIFKSGVGEGGLFFICELRDDTAIAKKVADQINQGMLKSYSIAGSATKIQNMKKGETPYMQVDEMELAEVTICEKGVNQGANFELLKAELPQTGKIDKDQCGYRDATAPEEKMGINCGHCKYFNSDTRTCDVVVGDIMPGDYCRLFEQEDKPQAVVHRKIIIMHKDDTGRINFKDSFMGWMEKEKAGEDPLKSGKSFATLNNIAGREAEHHRLLQEFGFPSEPILETMRYIPVVETETDDDGKPINIIPPWVVNEAGQDLADKLDNDEITSVNKAMDIINDILRKAPIQADDPSANTPNPRKRYKAIDKAPIGVGGNDPSDPVKPPTPRPPENQYQMGQGIQTTTPNVPEPNVPAPNTETSTAPPSYVPQQPMTQREQRGKEFGEMREGAEKPLGQMKRIFRGAPQAAADKGREAMDRGSELRSQAAVKGREAMDRGKEKIGAGTKRMGELFGAGKKRLGEAGQAVKRGAIRADLAAGEAGRRVKAGAQEAGRRAVEGGRRVGAAGQEAGKRVAAGGRELGRRAAYDAKGAQEAGGRAVKRGAALGRQAGRGAQEAGRKGKAGAKEAYRRGAEGASELGGGLKEGFRSYDRDARSFDEIQSGGGQRDQFGNLRRTAADGRKGPIEANRSGARRIGQLFGAGTRGAGEAAGEQTRMAAQEVGRFGRGVARGATPGKTGQDWRDRERGDFEANRGPTKRSASEKFGQWLGSQGRERTADALDTTGQTARGFRRGIVPGERGKRLRAEEAASGQDRTWGEKIGQAVGTGTRGAGRQAGNVGTKAGRELPKFGSRAKEQEHMMNNEGVGRGVNFQPNAHRGASVKEQHQMVTGLTDKVNDGQDMSPKEWMQLVHHMSQSPDGQQYANFSDIDISHGDWNKPMKFSDMRQHLDRMNVSHGTHGDTGKRGYANLVNKLENVTSGKGGNLTLKPLTESEGPDTNYNDSDDRQEEKPDDRQENQDENNYQRNQRERKEREQRERTAEVDMSLNKMAQYKASTSVPDSFKRAFKITI